MHYKRTNHSVVDDMTQPHFYFLNASILLYLLIEENNLPEMTRNSALVLIIENESVSIGAFFVEIFSQNFLLIENSFPHIA